MLPKYNTNDVSMCLFTEGQEQFFFHKKNKKNRICLTFVLKVISNLGGEENRIKKAAKHFTNA